MTISYTGQVANARLCGFIKLLFYWKGSIYKLMYKEMLIFVALYYLISAAYRFALVEAQKRVFEKVVLHCANFIDLIPLSFVLGFYVAIVVGRWWNQFMSVPWPDRLMIYVGTLVQGVDERGRIIRRTLMRYLSLASVITFQSISTVAKKRFPTYAHMLEAGLLNESEQKVIEELPSQHPKYWVPIMWCSTLLMQARKEGRVPDDISLKTLLDEVNSYRNGLGTLMMFDWISIPLVYTQVTTLAVYSFFLGSLFGRQFLDPTQGYKGHEVDMYVPIFTLLQFFFYMGWIKVAEQLINPFGDDEDDFETNYIIDRNLQISLLAVDEMHNELPQLERDAFWDDVEPNLPHTIASVDHKTQSYLGSTADLSLSGEDMKVIPPMETIPEVMVSREPKSLISSSINLRSSPTSPIHQRRLYQNMFGSLQHPLNLSTLDGLKTSLEDHSTRKAAATKPLKPFVQTLDGPELVASGSAPPASYIQHWLDKNQAENHHFPFHKSAGEGSATPLHERKHVPFGGTDGAAKEEADAIGAEKVGASQNYANPTVQPPQTFQPQQTYSSSTIQPPQTFGSASLQPPQTFGSASLQPPQTFGSASLQPPQAFGTSPVQSSQAFGSSTVQPSQTFSTQTMQPSQAYSNPTHQPSQSYSSPTLQPPQTLSAPTIQPYSSPTLHPSQSYGSQITQASQSFSSPSPQASQSYASSPIQLSSESYSSPTTQATPSYSSTTILAPDPENPSVEVEYAVECEGNQSTVSSTAPLLEDHQDWAQEQMNTSPATATTSSSQEQQPLI